MVSTSMPERDQTLRAALGEGARGGRFCPEADGRLASRACLSASARLEALAAELVAKGSDRAFEAVADHVVSCV